MKRLIRSIDEALSYGAALDPAMPRSAGLDRILKSTRLEDRLYADARKGDAAMDGTVSNCSAKLPTFPALARDMFQSFYSLSVRRNDESELSDVAKRFNSHILDGVTSGAEYPTIKSACEGRPLPAYDAAAEFTAKIADNLDDLLKEAGGDRNALGTLGKLAAQERKLKQELGDLIQSRDGDNPDPELDRRIIDKADKAASKARQTEAVGRQVRDSIARNRDAIDAIVSHAAQSAADKAEETAAAIDAWGAGEDGADPERMEINRRIVGRVRKSKALTEAAKHLGRFREMAAKARKNGYAYNRGEKYTLELGNDLARILTSEFSTLAVPEAIPLFLRKYQNKRLMQYRRREHVHKGGGDIIMCLDESGSTKSDAPWGKAVALALLDAAMAGGRKFALIHFDHRDNLKTDLFVPGGYGTEEVLAAAETFLGGGTDFETPLKEALRLMEHEGFENADIVFMTDGICPVADAFADEIKRKKAERGFRITGILMDAESPGMAFSLERFCGEVYRTSELARDAIAEAIISARV